MKFRDYIKEEYEIAKSPADGSWYVLGRAGKHWMPVSTGFKSRKDAEKFKKKQPLADKVSKGLVKEGISTANVYKNNKGEHAYIFPPPAHRKEKDINEI